MKKFHVHGVMLAVAVLWVAFHIVPSPAFGAKSYEVQAMGSSLIKDGNLAKAKSESLDNALQNAVYNAVHEMLSSKNVIANFQFLTEKILQAGKDFIQDYRIDAESNTDVLFAVAVSATINGQLLHDIVQTAGLDIADKREKTFLLVFEDPNEYQTLITNELRSSLAPAGIRLKPLDKSVYLPQRLGIPTWCDIARQKNSDFILLFSSSTSCTSGKEKKINCQASASVKVVDAANYLLSAVETFLVEDEYGSSEEGNIEIIQPLVRKTAEVLNGLFQGQLKNSNSAESPIKIHLNGVTRYLQYEQVRRSLMEEIPGVSEVLIDSASGLEFVLGVKFRGSLDQLETSLLQLQFNGFDLISKGRKKETIYFDIQQ